MLNSLIIHKNRLISINSNSLNDKFSEGSLSRINFSDILDINRNLIQHLDLFIVTDNSYYKVFKNRYDGQTGELRPIKTLSPYIAYLESCYDSY